MEKNDMVYILCNTNFMNWLMKKLSENYFIDDLQSKLDENDVFYAKKLETLFEIISEYAHDNGIEAMKSNQNNIFYVCRDEYVFCVYEGSNSYGCFKYDIDKGRIPYCINLEDVRRCKIEDIICNSDTFNGLKKELISLNNKGISPEFISQITSKLLYKINNEEKGHTYKKK